MSDTQKNETVATEQPPAAPVSATEPGSAPASEKKQPFFTRRTVLAMTGCGVAGLVVGGVLASWGVTTASIASGSHRAAYHSYENDRHRPRSLLRLPALRDDVHPEE